MAAAPARDQALSLLAAANNHGDLAVKLSSLKQAKDILFSIEPSQAAELFHYLAELQSSPETLVRKYLLEVIDEVGAKPSEHLCILFPVLLTFLKDNNLIVVKQSIITGTKFFSCVLEELALQVSFSSLYSHSLHVCLCKCVSVSVSVDGTVGVCAL
ncbi:uncharacterized protein LOC121753679 [Salvia splendens]|uniref:uncharacterized protein LOC121753679 n=1 Tax=Salvia splendens TaxID=180675 RepID=UPI001C262959|nr:uncharacterized protein LOC121753679 [Salvia splendens]